jgi:2-polyprenyl-6-methoxyphenol hydroxylase-like FAD-dependent oxidoreductase
MKEIIIIGAGIGGLVLALELIAEGICPIIYESAPEIQPVGYGINLLPYAVERLSNLGLVERLLPLGVCSKETVWSNARGEIVHKEPTGHFAGERWPQLSISRSVLQQTLLRAVIDRSGAERVLTGWKCVDVSNGADRAYADFVETRSQRPLPRQEGAVVVGCDGQHSAVRQRLFPGDRGARRSGIDMWRGTSNVPAILTGESIIRIGLPEEGKLVAYPISRDENGLQTINWVAEISDHNAVSGATDPAAAFSSWNFGWIDVPGLLRKAERPVFSRLCDTDPLPFWSQGHITLLGDAAHSMLPFGSNGAGQAMLDAAALARCLAQEADPVTALLDYERIRLPNTVALQAAEREGGVDRALRSFQNWSWNDYCGDSTVDRINNTFGALLKSYRGVGGKILMS